MKRLILGNLVAKYWAINKDNFSKRLFQFYPGNVVDSSEGVLGGEKWNV
jgi:hypothetical protein